jgi:hypothetical protein
MANVTIRCFKAEDEASFATNKAKAAGRKVAVAGPTDKVKILGGEPDKIEWDAGASVKWWIVIETSDALVMP